MTIRTRFAPSPTGFLHIGGARTALFNFLFARHHRGQFILRIEDTDAARNTREANDAIFDGLKWLGLDWDEGEGKGEGAGEGSGTGKGSGKGEGAGASYRQSERSDIYDRWFEQLQQKDRVYEQDGAWFFRFERKPVTIDDLVCGEVTIDYRDESNTPDMVIRRGDGSYVFHFVNVVDDLEMEISHVIRGEDHLMNTPKHMQLFEAFGVPAPIYAHIPLILNSDGSKMSKRDRGAAVSDYKAQGFLPEAVTNFIALLGWSPKSEEEIFSLDELAERFDLAQVNRAPARFDLEKCKWVNQQHLLKLDPATFAEKAQQYVEEANLPINDHRYPAAAAAVQEKVHLLTEVPDALGFIFADSVEPDPEATAKVAKNPDAAALLTALAEAFQALPEWSGQAAKEAIATVASANDAKPGQLMFPTRVALSGRAGGPDLVAILELLGQTESSKRLEKFTIHLK